MKGPKPNSRQLAVSVAVVLALIIVGGIVWGFGRQIMLARQMQEEEDRLEQAVAAEERRQEELLAQLEYVQSDAYVENWAREEAKMAKPGEVVFFTPGDSEEETGADDQPPISEETVRKPFWKKWWQKLFAPSKSAESSK